jgi:DNA topoisomerase-1
VQGGAAAVVAAHVEASAADREKGDETDETPNGSEVVAPPSLAVTPAQRPALPEAKTKTQILPAMKAGDQPAQERIAPEEHFTQPPPRYTEASLVKKLEREGIGRPSTYAAILSRVQDVGYAQKLGTGGRAPLMATPLGILVTERLEGHFPSIMELGFTRDMESELDKIEEAHLDWRKAVADFYGPFARDLDNAKKNMSGTKLQGEKTDIPCPTCGSMMEKRLSKFGYYLRCSSTKEPECKTTLRLDAQGNVQKKAEPQQTGLKCDLCGAAVVKSVGRFGAYLHCVNYRPKPGRAKPGQSEGPAVCTFTMKVDREGKPVRKFRPIPTDRKCEKCGSMLVVRVTARRGRKQKTEAKDQKPDVRTPKPFLCCSNFPKCRAAADLPPELGELGQQAVRDWAVMDAKNKADAAVYSVPQA